MALCYKVVTTMAAVGIAYNMHKNSMPKLCNLLKVGIAYCKT